MRFVEAAGTSLRESGWSVELAALSTSALVEMASNAVEHSESSYAPIVTFEALPPHWTFSVTDVGRGLRASLVENARYANLRSDQEAMEACLTDGVSRHGTPGHGTGFTTVFRALADRRSTLSFRSGTASGEWTGTSPTAQTLLYRVLPRRSGFHLEVGYQP
jgi:hypothetical protein